MASATGKCWTMLVCTIIVILAFMNFWFFVIQGRGKSGSNQILSGDLMMSLNSAVKRLERLESDGGSEIGRKVDELIKSINSLRLEHKDSSNEINKAIWYLEEIRDSDGTQSKKVKKPIKRSRSEPQPKSVSSQPPKPKNPYDDIKRKGFEDPCPNKPLLSNEGMDPALFRLNKAMKTLKATPNNEFHPFEKTKFHPQYLKRDVDVIVDMLASKINANRFFHTHKFKDPNIIQRFRPDQGDHPYGMGNCREWFERALLVNHKWPSQVGQDWLSYFNYIAGFDDGQKGFFVEVGANHPRIISNSFFLEKCLGWEGICIDANPDNVRLLKEQRSCTVVPMCVSNVTEKLLFYPTYEQERESNGGSGALTELTTDNIQRDKHHIEVQCDTLDNILETYAPGRDRINFLTIDIEGAEGLALQGLDLQKTVVDMIVIEFNKIFMDEQYKLEDQGYHKVFTTMHDFVFMKELTPIFTFQDYDRMYRWVRKDGDFDWAVQNWDDEY